ncbi:MAG TPA: SpoIIE family protein phosphatase, partial [Limnochordales bacterium]
QSGGPPGSTYAERVYGRVCETCPSAVHCWQTHGQETFWEVLEFVDACRERQQRGGDEPTPMPQRLAARCIQPGRLAGAVEEVARLAAVEQWALATLQRAYRRVQAELWAVGSVLKESREAALQELGPGDGQAAARIRRHLRRYGAPAPWAWVLGQGGRREVHVGWGGPCGAAGRCVQLACRAVQEVEGVPHSPVGGTCWAGREGAGPGAGVGAGVGAGAGSSGAGCTVVLAPRPTLGAEVAFAGRTCAGQEVSGDRFLRAELGPAVVAVVLSDGMGHGPEACRESEAAVRLVEQALRTGADTRAAIRCANAALLARSAEERFATLDVAVVDLAAGQLELAKAGAYPSFLWRAGQLERLEGRALPAGIMEAVEVEVVRRPLADGDLLVMVTDGAAQLGPAAEACIAEVAEALARADPRQGARVLAEGIVEALGALAPQGWPDDVTVAVLQVRELDGGNGASYSGSGWVRPARAQEEGKQHHRRAAVARV